MLKQDQTKTTSHTPSALLDNAIGLALFWHDGQVRKGDGTPYSVHPIAVATLLAKHGFDDEVVAAGFCHDLLEDTACPETVILSQCGESVLKTVRAVTNDDSLDWQAKKLTYIAGVKSGSDAAKAVCCADKIHNLQSLLAAYERQGSAIWQHFNRGYADKLWFEESVLQMLKETWAHSLLNIYGELVAEMQKLPH